MLNDIVFLEAGKGLNLDTPSVRLPPQAFTRMENAAVRSGQLVRVGGELAVYGSPSVAPLWTMFVPTLSKKYWLYASASKVYAIDGSAHADITRTSGDYTGGSNDFWTGAILSSLPIITNGVDAPQVWNPTLITQPLVDLPNWPAGYTARVLQTFKNFVVAGDVTDAGGTRNGAMVKWSDAAQPGQVPGSWDPADATKKAGETELQGSTGRVMAMRPLGDANIIYLETGVSSMRFIGGVLVFSFDNILSTVGLLAPRCVSLVEELSAHFIVTQDDIMLFDGRRVQSLGHRRLRSAVFSLIDATFVERCFTVVNRRQREVWFCLPQAGHEWPNLAVVWNWREDSFNFRDLADVAHASPGYVDFGAGPNWDSKSEAWDSSTSYWGTSGELQTPQDVLMAVPQVPGSSTTSWDSFGTGDTWDSLTSSWDTYGTATSELRGAENGAQFAGVDYTTRAERVNIPLVNSRDVLITARKLCRRVWIKASGNSFNVYVGASEEPEGAVDWQGPLAFNPATDQYVDCSVNGKFISVRFEATSGGAWQVAGYTPEFEVLGDM